MSKVRIAVGSTNPSKLAAVRQVADRLFPGSELVHLACSGGIAAQPMSDAEAIRGARNRARQAVERTTADFGVGIEAAVVRIAGDSFVCTWVVVRARDGSEGLACSARAPLPDGVAAQVARGETLERAIEGATGESGIGRRGGAMALISGGGVTREDATAQAVRFAFARYHSVLFRP